MRYFAYGSNTYGPQMRSRVPDAVPHVTARAVGYAFAWVRKPSGDIRATIVADTADRFGTCGVIYNDVSLDALDVYEGTPHVYERIEINVQTSGGVESCFTYAYRDHGGAVVCNPDRRSAAYAARVAVGRAEFGLDTPGAHVVAVYGTLMSGQANHGVLVDRATLAMPVGETNVYGATLYDLGPYPAMQLGHGAVRCEVWVVGDAELRRLDRLEGVPHLYRREKLWTASGHEVSAYLYAADLSASAAYQEITEHMTTADWRTWQIDPRRGR